MKLLNFKEASDYLNIKESRLRNSVFRKEVPFVKIGRLVRFKKEALDEFIKENTILPSTGNNINDGFRGDLR